MEKLLLFTTVIVVVTASTMWAGPVGFFGSLIVLSLF